MKYAPLFLFAVLLLASCDSYQIARGTVLDADTNQPLEGVLVYNKRNDHYHKYTDSTGNFVLVSPMARKPVCPPMNMVVQKENYKTLEITPPAGEHQTIKLTRLKQIP